MTRRHSRTTRHSLPRLLVGFDSAWTPGNRGALAAALQLPGGRFQDLGPPLLADFPEASARIQAWEAEHRPEKTLVLLDQPTIVPNATGQRPAENLVGAPISRRRGGVQPANTGRERMFGPEAPLWPFLAAHGGAPDPRTQSPPSGVLETYPALTLAALAWTRPDTRPAGRFPRYNPANRKKFSLEDWAWLCEKLRAELAPHQLPALVSWLEHAARLPRPRKPDQDMLDAALCLSVALHLAQGLPGLMIGTPETGFLVVPATEPLEGRVVERSWQRR